MPADNAVVWFLGWVALTSSVGLYPNWLYCPAMDNGDVQELLDFHNQELRIDELTEMHEQERDVEEKLSL
ncbi:hypothetical protein TNCV_1506731 [Trichonephila clavipes]|nr:hypothetical protein TNCV_1506731 [Trichonephila clavipes]